MAKNKKNLGMSRSQIERSRKTPKRDRFGKKPLPSNYFDEKENKFKEHIDINAHRPKPTPGQIIQQLPRSASTFLTNFNVSLGDLDTISELEKRIKAGLARPWLPPVIYETSRTLYNPRYYQYSPENRNDTDEFIKSNSRLGLYQYDDMGNQIQTRSQFTPAYYNQCHSGGDTNWSEYIDYYNTEDDYGGFSYGDDKFEYDENIGDCGYVSWGVLHPSATRCQSMCQRYCSGTTHSSNCNNGVTGPDGVVHYPQYNDNPYDSDTPPNGGCGIYNICGTNSKHDDDWSTYEVVWADWARVTCVHDFWDFDTDCKCQCAHKNTNIRINSGFEIGSQNISTTPGGGSGDVTPDGSDGSNEDTWETPVISACFFDEACNDAGTNLDDAGAYSWCYDHPNGIYYPPGYQGDNVGLQENAYCQHNGQLCDFSCYGCTNPASPSYDSSATKSCNGTYGPEGEMNHDFGGGTNSCCDFQDIRTTGNRFRLRYTWDEVAVNLVGDPYTDTAGTLNVFWTNSFVGTRGRSINWAEEVPFILENGVVPEYLSGNNLYPKIGSSFWLNWTKYGDVCRLNDYTYTSTSTGEDTLLLDPFTDVNSTLVNCDGDFCGPNILCGSTNTIDIGEDEEFTISANPIEYDWYGFDGNPHPSIYDPVALSYTGNDWLPTKVRLTIEGTPELVGDVLKYSYRATSENIDRVGFIYVNKFTGLQGSGEGNSNNGTLITWSQTDGSTETGYVKDVYGNVNLDDLTEYSMDIILDNGGTFKMWTGSDSHLLHPKDFQYGEYIVNAPAGMFRRAGSDDYEGIYEINTTPLDAVANDDVYCETWEGETAEECGYFKLSFCNNETSDEDVLDSWVVDGVNNLNDTSNENIWKNVNRNPGPAWFNSKPMESDGEPPNINTLWEKSIKEGGSFEAKSCAFQTIPEDSNIQKSPHLSITKTVLYDRPIKEEETLDADGNVINVQRTSFKYEYGHCNTTPVNALVKTFEGYFAVNGNGKILGPVMGKVVDGGAPGGRIRIGSFKSGCDSTIGQNYDCRQLSPLVCDTFGLRYGCRYSNVHDMCECDSPYMGCGEDNLSNDACIAGTNDLDFCIGDQSEAFAGTANSVEIPSSDAVFDEYCAQSNYDTIFLLNTGTLLSSIKHHGDEVVSEDGSYLDWKSGYSNVNNWNPGATLYGAQPTLSPESLGYDGYNDICLNNEHCHDYYSGTENEINPMPMHGDVRRLNGKFDNMYRNHHLKISGKSKHKWCFNYYADWENFNGDEGEFCTEGDWFIKGTNAMDKDSETEYPSGTSTKLLQFGSKRGNLMIPQHIKVGVDYNEVFVPPGETFKYTFSGSEATVEVDGEGPYGVASYASNNPALTANNFCLTKGFDAVLDYALTSMPLGAPYWYHCGDTPNEAQFEISDKFTSLFDNLQGITYYKNSGSPGWPEDQFVGKPSICQGVIMEWRFNAQTAQMIDNLAFGQEEQQYAYYDLTADVEDLLDFPFYLSTYPSDFDGDENDYEGWMYPGGGYLNTHHQVYGGGQYNEVGHVYKVFDGVDYKLAVCTDLHYSVIYYDNDVQYGGWGLNGELSFPSYSRFSIRKGFAPNDVVDHFIQYLLPPCPDDGFGMANERPFEAGWNVGYNNNFRMDDIECVIYPNGQNSGGEIPSDLISPASDFNAEIKLLGDHSHWKQNSGNKWFGINNYQPIDQGGTEGIFTERLNQEYLNAIGTVPMGWTGNQTDHPGPSNTSTHLSPTGEGDAEVDYKLGRDWYEPGVCKMVEPQGYYLGTDDRLEINYNWPCEMDVSNENKDVSRNYILNSVYNLPDMYDTIGTFYAATNDQYFLPIPQTWNLTGFYLDEFHDEASKAFQAFYKSIYNPETSLMNYIITRGAYWETAQSSWAYTPTSLTNSGNYDWYNTDVEQWVTEGKGLCPYCLGHKYFNQFVSDEYDPEYYTEGLENNQFRGGNGEQNYSKYMFGCNDIFEGEELTDVEQYYNCYFEGWLQWSTSFKNFWLGDWRVGSFEEGYTVNFQEANYSDETDWSYGQGYYGNQNPFPATNTGNYSDTTNRTRDITLSANKYTIDLLCQSMGFESGKVMSWKNTTSGCSRYKRHMMFEPYYSDGSNPYDTDIPRLYLSHGQANVPILQETAWRNVNVGYDLSSEAPYGEQFMMGPLNATGLSVNSRGKDFHMWDTLEGLGYRGVTNPAGSSEDYDNIPTIYNGSGGAFYCPYGPAVIPHDIVCYSQDIWSPAQNYMYGEARHNHHQAKCDSFYNKDDFMAWFRAYYFAYYDRTISWMEAYEHPLFGEEVPYFVASEDPQNLKVRECGPEIVLLPSSEFIDSIQYEGVNVAWYPGQRPGVPTTESIIKPWNNEKQIHNETPIFGIESDSSSGLELYAPTPEQNEAFSYINYSLMSRTTYEKSCGTCPQDYVCRISISNGSKCQPIDTTSDDDIIHNDVNYGLLIFDNSWLNDWYTNSNDSVLYRQINPTYDDTPGIIPEVNKPPSPL